MACGRSQVDMDISDHELAIEDMMRYHETGFTTWDLADIYGPAEDFIGNSGLNYLH